MDMAKRSAPAEAAHAAGEDLSGSIDELEDLVSCVVPAATDGEDNGGDADVPAAEPATADVFGCSTRHTPPLLLLPTCLASSFPSAAASAAAALMSSGSACGGGWSSGWGGGGWGGGSSRYSCSSCDSHEAAAGDGAGGSWLGWLGGGHAAASRFATCSDGGGIWAPTLLPPSAARDASADLCWTRAAVAAHTDAAAAAGDMCKMGSTAAPAGGGGACGACGGFAASGGISGCSSCTSLCLLAGLKMEDMECHDGDGAAAAAAAAAAEEPAQQAMGGRTEQGEYMEEDDEEAGDPTLPFMPDPIHVRLIHHRQRSPQQQGSAAAAAAAAAGHHLQPPPPQLLQPQPPGGAQQLLDFNTLQAAEWVACLSQPGGADSSSAAAAIGSFGSRSLCGGCAASGGGEAPLCAVDLVRLHLPATAGTATASNTAAAAAATAATAAAAASSSPGQALPPATQQHPAHQVLLAARKTLLGRDVRSEALFEEEAMALQVSGWLLVS